MYERAGDHLQAEFDRILVALNALTEMEVGIDESTVDQRVTDVPDTAVDVG